MSKYLNVPNGDYKLTVQPGGTIYLDTGLDIGQVVISGNLTVNGTQTIVNTTELSIEDRVIELNRSDVATNGVQGDGISGLQISRGNYADAYLVFVEGLTEDAGRFVLRNNDNELISLQTNEIFSNSSTLTLNSGSSTVSVNTTTDYEKKIFTYAGSTLTGYNPTKADTIPNTQAVVDYVAYNFANVFLRQIGDGFVTVSSIEIDDFENTGDPSTIVFKIDAVPVAEVYADRWDFSQIRLTGTTIETINVIGSEDLVLRANGTGNVRIDDMLHINSVPSIDDATLVPTFPDEGIRLYVDNQYTGKTGIFFANAEENRDELVSKNRALLFGMLF
tara:strand:+ start:32 stop:1030 length:999 start_codon:yes stop_codon:yes gene_type:complete